MVTLTIIDAWDWQDEHAHLLALQSKLNAYFAFIESKQIFEDYPEASHRELEIFVLGRYPMPQAGIDLLRLAADAGADLVVAIRRQHGPWPD